MTVSDTGARESGIENVAVVFDGSHCDRLRKALALSIRFEELVSRLVHPHRLARAVYYKDLRDEAERKGQAALLMRVASSGIAVKGSLPEDMRIDSRERYGTNLVELAVETLTNCENLDRVILFAGDRKQVPLVRALQDRGIRVVVTTALDVPTAIRASPLLLDTADEYRDLSDYLVSNFQRHRAKGFE
ncbi:NYN domain-containing protein [Aurantimonas sp. A2-1-M11]|uniref:NYN domain-containing protein n=1 Tax=Aurantimonas sp. A2-1-M11 TaxID=3113712 RepID=UPI002F92A460